MSMDVLIKKILEKKNPSVIGLDPRPEYIPPEIMKKHISIKGETLEAAADAYYEFNRGLIDALCEFVPAVKPQSAFYELLGPAGVEALKKTISYARSKGLYVIADVKRNDIGSTAQAYSEAYLGFVKIGETAHRTFDCDSVTVSAYLGSDGIKPFLDVCRRENKTLFALVKTSNSSSGELQDLKTGTDKVYELVGKILEEISKDTIGEYGYTACGAVIGATYPQELSGLRKLLGNTFFLVPGYGAQGGRAEDVAGAFDERGLGAVVNSSRAVICAWMKTGRGGTDYAEAARNEAISMKADITKYCNWN